MKSRRKFTPEFKAKVALEAMQERDSMAQLAKKYQLTVVQINKWKRELKENSIQIFKKSTDKKDGESDKEKQKLFEIIGKQKVEIDFLKNALS